jgi:hypothetical protein
VVKSRKHAAAAAGHASAAAYSPCACTSSCSPPMMGKSPPMMGGGSGGGSRKSPTVAGGFELQLPAAAMPSALPSALPSVPSPLVPLHSRDRDKEASSGVLPLRREPRPATAAGSTPSPPSGSEGFRRSARGQPRESDAALDEL